MTEEQKNSVERLIEELTQKYGSPENIVINPAVGEMFSDSDGGLQLEREIRAAWANQTLDLAQNYALELHNQVRNNHPKRSWILEELYILNGLLIDTANRFDKYAKLFDTTSEIDDYPEEIQISYWVFYEALESVYEELNALFFKVESKSYTHKELLQKLSSISKLLNQAANCLNLFSNVFDNMSSIPWRGDIITE